MKKKQQLRFLWNRTLKKKFEGDEIDLFVIIGGYSPC